MTDLLARGILSVLLFTASSAGVAAQGDPASQAEVDVRFPLPQHLGAFYVAATRELVQAAYPVLNAQLFDYPSARFMNVHAVVRFDWHSINSVGNYLCGQVNAKNRMGAYIGWRNFLITHKQGEPPQFQVGVGLGDGIEIPMVCNGSHEDRYVTGTTDYSAMLSYHPQ